MTLSRRALALLAFAAGVACLPQAGATIYDCVDASGRHISSDRPIEQCNDRGQRILNPSGTVRQSVGPALSETERAAQDERKRREEVERLRVNEERMRQRALLSRYPTPAVLERERLAALAPIDAVITSAGERLAALDAQRQRLVRESAANPSSPNAQRSLELHDQQRAAQWRFLNSKRAEKDLVTLRFAERARQLQPLWGQPLPAASSAEER